MTQAVTLRGATAHDTLGCELAAEVLRSFGELRFRANGSSMLPAVWPGDMLLVRSQDAAAVVPGDIVLFGRGGRLFAHRVVEVRSLASGVRSQKTGFRIWDLGFRSRKDSQISNLKSQIIDREFPTPNPETRNPNPVPRAPCLVSRIELVTRGDSLDRDDPPASSHELLGRVTAIQRGSRRVSLRFTFWHRIGAAILSRSEFCTRLLLGLRKAGTEEPGFVIRG